MPSLGMVFPFFGSDVLGRFAGPTSHCQDKGILRTIVPDWRGSAPPGCAGSLERWYRRKKSF